MIKTLLKYSSIGLILFTAFFVNGCSSSGQGEADTAAPLVEQSFSEDCAFCHGPGRIAAVDPSHALESGDLMGEINDVAIDNGMVTVDFELFDKDNPGVPVPGMDANEIRFSLVKLGPGIDPSKSPDWQSYINSTEVKQAGDPGSAPDGTSRIQATAERASTSGGVFTDNGDGSYSYQFSFDITNVTDPIGVSYDPTLKHRVAMQVSDNVDNAFIDFVPDGPDPVLSRDIVSNASCNECHIKLGFHGGDRIAVQYCVACHNPGSIDANSDNSVDFTVMIHKIHRGANLPSVEAGGEYAIWGFRNSKHDYSHVEYPQDIRNCTKCHDGSDPATPDGDNWMTNPSIDACRSCHDTTSFVTPVPEGMTLHTAGPRSPTSDCLPCHAPDSIVASHRIPSQVAAERFKYNILSIQNTEPGQFPAVTFSVTDPTRAGIAYDILSDPEFTAPAGASRLAILIGWESDEFTNRDSDSNPAQPISINPLAEGVAQPNADGSFTVVSPTPIPSDASDSGAVAVEGHPAVESDPEDEPGVFDLRVPVKSVVQFFPITDTQGVARRQVVAIEKCNECHGSLSLHGNNRTDEIDICVMCHNPNATDINRRPDNPALTADNRNEETIDFKYMIHAIHAAGFRDDPIVVYGFGNTEHVFDEVGLPTGMDNLLNCRGCHVNGAFQLPLAQEVFATTVDTGDDISDPDDDVNITPVSSACSSCHDDITSTTHMTEEGGSFNFVRFVAEEPEDTGGPAGVKPPGHTNRTDCATCHGP